MNSTFKKSGFTQHLVGIAQMKISNSPTEILVAPNLGSCLGIIIYDPKQKIGGMVHCLLPMSQSNPEKAKAEPYAFVDTGVVQLLNELIKKGSNKNDLLICVAGGSNINDSNNVFEIGKKNYTVFRKILWKNNLLIKAEHVGDSISRTFTLDVGTGDVWLKCNGEEQFFINLQ